MITSSLAVAVAAPVTHLEHPLTWPDSSLSYLFIVLALAIAPLAAAVGLAFDKVMALARPKPQIRSWTLIPAVAAAGLATGICSIWYPELPGNGRSILTVSVSAGLTLTGAAVIFVLKPLLTAFYLRTGAVGGLITPALATGAAAGSLVTLALNHFAGTDIQVAAVSLTCAAGVLAITQRAPRLGRAVRLGARETSLLAADRLHGGRLRRAWPQIAPRAEPGSGGRTWSLELLGLHPRARVADDADRHRAREVDVLDVGPHGDDRGVLQDRQHGRHVPQARFHGGQHFADVLGAVERGIDLRLNASVADAGQVARRLHQLAVRGRGHGAWSSTVVVVDGVVVDGDGDVVDVALGVVLVLGDEVGADDGVAAVATSSAVQP